MAELIEQESLWRVLLSLGALATFFALGLLVPYRRSQALTDRKRWLTNLSLTFGNGIIMRIIRPLGLIGLTQTSMFNFLKLWEAEKEPLWVQLIFGVVILDLAIYWQHRLTHKIPLLWRFHRVHHSDVEIDTTTAGRFHTFEILLSFLLKAVVVVALDIHPAAILFFEILLNFSSLFNHTNIQFPTVVENILRLLVITPALHRIHHSTRTQEMNSNFGFSVSLWDRVFGSYNLSSVESDLSMDIGLHQFRGPEEQTLWALLKQPFLKKQKK